MTWAAGWRFRLLQKEVKYGLIAYGALWVDDLCVKTAKALGLTIPPSLLLRADQVTDDAMDARARLLRAVVGFALVPSTSPNWRALPMA